MTQLTLIDKAFLLKQTTVFANLDLDLLLPIADKLGSHSYEKGEMIFEKGEEARRMFIVVHGLITILNGKEKVLAELSSNAFFGDEALFNYKPRKYSAHCETEAALLSLSRTNLLTIIGEYPSVAVNLLEVYTANLDFRGG